MREGSVAGMSTGDYECQKCRYTAPRNSEQWYRQSLDENETATRIVQEATEED